MDRWSIVWIFAAITALSLVLGSPNEAQASPGPTPTRGVWQCGGFECGSEPDGCHYGSIAFLIACGEAHSYSENPGEVITVTSLHFHPATPDYMDVDVELNSSVRGRDVDFMGTQTPSVGNRPKERNLGCPGCSEDGAPLVGNPLNLGTGNKFQPETDYVGSGAFPLTMVRYYNSDGGDDNTFGKHWSHTYDRQVIYQSLTQMKLYRDDGEVRYFTSCGTLLWCATDKEPGTLTEDADENGDQTAWHYRDENDVVEDYDAAGVLVAETSKGGFQHLFHYATGYLSSISDPEGRSIGVTYDTSHRISQLTLPDGQIITYAYDAAGNLSTVTRPDQTVRTYFYDEPAYVTAGADPGMLSGIQDENGNRYATYQYDSQSRVIDSAHALLADRVSVTYPTAGSAIVTDARGAERTYTVGDIQDVYNVGGVQGASCAGCVNFAAFGYNAAGDVTQRTDFNGVTTTLLPNTRHLVETMVEALGTSVQRTTQTEWDPVYNLPLSRALTNAAGTMVTREAWVYNGRGQVLAQCQIDPAVAPGYVCAATGTPPDGVRRTTHTYCDTADGITCPIVGLMLTTDGPRKDVNDITMFSYYLTSSAINCGTPGAACYQAGDLYQEKDPTGQFTTYASYDAAGRPTRITDANGTNTDITYNSRGWVLTQTVGGATTAYGYDNVGNITQITDPDNVTTTYSYDASHRLTDVTDALGNHIHYTLDGAGDRTAEAIYDSTNVMRRSVSRTFDSLGRLTSKTDGLNQVIFSANFSDSYDLNGNLIHSTDALSVQRKQSFDALNRLSSTIDDYNGTNTSTKNTTIQYGRDAQDHLVNVVDPSNLATSYAVDVFGNTTGTISPDTGASLATFDAVGNRLTTTDARGIVTTSAFDALNRILSTSFTDPTLNVVYHYDEANTITGCASSKPIGRLTRIVENAITTTFCYDVRGNVISKLQTMGAITDTTSFTYTSADRLKSLTYPSGSVVVYSRNANGQITSASLTPLGGVTAAVVSAVDYLPFGPVLSYQLGNGQVVTRNYDANYAYTDVSSPAFFLHLARDASGSITALGAAHGASPATETFSYDPLYRLTTVLDGATSVQSVSYNASGDRLTKTGSGLSVGNYVYQASTHRISAIGNAARASDANGNTTAATTGGQAYGFGYNGRNRMTVVQLSGQTVGTYVYNALGERVSKASTLPAVATERFSYGADKQLLGEYGTTNRDYVRIDAIPVAVVDVVDSSGTVSYIHADGLGVPRAITNASGTTVWQWAYTGNPWGEAAPSGSYTFNLRFPGQYFDAESGLVDNINRAYEPSTGRYIQSDPIGLFGGVSTYTYGAASPLLRSDPLGLRCEKEDRCEQQYSVDNAVCRSLPNRTDEDKRVRAACWSSANERYGNCLADRPIGPLITQLSTVPDPEPQKGSNTQPGRSHGIHVPPTLGPVPEVPSVPEVPIFEPIEIPAW